VLQQQTTAARSCPAQQPLRDDYGWRRGSTVQRTKGATPSAKDGTLRSAVEDAERDTGVAPLSWTGKDWAAHATKRRSYVSGETRPRAECRRRELYQPSIQSNTASFASACVRKRRRSSSSHSNVAKKLSAIALS